MISRIAIHSEFRAFRTRSSTSAFPTSATSGLKSYSCKANGGGITWVGGVYYSSQHINHPNDTLALPQFGSTGTGAQSLVDNTSRAIFGQATFPLAMVEGLSLTAGARYTKDDRDMTARKFVDVERTTCALTDGKAQRCRTMRASCTATNPSPRRRTTSVSITRSPGTPSYISRTVAAIGPAASIICLTIRRRSVPLIPRSSRTSSWA